jgi:type I restriction enzyme, R subunit
MKFTEAQLEQAIIELLAEQGIPHALGEDLQLAPEEVLIEADLRAFLRKQYASYHITEAEIDRILHELRKEPASDLYGSNKTILQRITNGFDFERDDPEDQDFHIYLIDYSAEDRNLYKIVNQLAIEGYQKRIPDGILYINGLPLVIFEFKSAIREEVNLHEAYIQLTVRYRRDIPELFKYNAFCIISDGVNSKAGSFFAPYEFYYAWRRTGGQRKDAQGIKSLHTLIEGMFERHRLRDIIRHFVYFPDVSRKEEKIVCRYPQYYAARALFANIKKHQRPAGDGRGGTYFGATGSGKSYTMLFLTRLLMRSKHFNSPTIVLITDRTDLDDQLSKLFTNAKAYIGDELVVSVDSRAQLRELLQGRQSGGVFLTTIHKFTEDLQLLTERTNVICISDEAHRSQTNLDQKVRITSEGIKKTYGFAKYLHDSLPNATYVGFTGTPVDATLDVFGKVVDAYTMTESVQDEITVRIVYEGRAAKVALNNSKLQEIEDYYERCADEGANEHQVEESKKAMSKMQHILGDPQRLQAIAEDFIAHYEKRLAEGATVLGKAMFVCANRQIAWDLYQRIVDLRPEWKEVRAAAEDTGLTEAEKRKLKPMEYVKMIMTRGKDDPPEMYEKLGTKEYRKELDRQFKLPHSNFKIAIVVDMWLTGFDVPFLDTMYIDKPIKRHTLIQTISRVNRKYEGKEKGLVVDYIGIKKQMNLALAQFNKTDKDNFEDIQQSIIVVRDHLDLLSKIFHPFDSRPYFEPVPLNAPPQSLAAEDPAPYRSFPLQQLHTLNQAAEFVQSTQQQERRFMGLVKRLKAAYDICAGSDVFTDTERDYIHFYLAVRSIVFKLTRGDAPDIAQMNKRVREMIEEALQSEGVEEIFQLGDDQTAEVDLFSDDYLAKIDKIKLPNTKIKLLQKLLSKAIEAFKKVNRMQGIDFSRRFEALVARYNERRDSDILRSEVLEDFTEEIIGLYNALRKEKNSFEDLGIDFEEKAFYDILKQLAHKYDFEYPEDKLLILAAEVKAAVDDKTKYTDWNQREDIKAELKADLIILLAEHDYPPVDRDEVYQEVFEQAEGFKRGRIKE